MSRARAAIPMLLCAALPACGFLRPDKTPRPVELGSFPYHPVVYHLDLAILAYQLHAQSLLWPFDPFYEERSGGAGIGRDQFMDDVRAWIPRHVPTCPSAASGLDADRGPGGLACFAPNPTHDPILFDYARIHPWRSAIMNDTGRWVEYLTPRAITGPIRDVYVSYRQAGKPEDAVQIAPVPAGRVDSDRDAQDILIAFEGGTGDKFEPGQPASQSLMGFVLARSTGPNAYDVHVAFRGSRSGSAARAVVEAASESEAHGNPDWITDLGTTLYSAGDGVADITKTGAVRRGFARSMQIILPTLFAALQRIADLKQGLPPGNIFVTGHSLGGGLAQLFASAILLGSGPPDALGNWPWRQLKLITFGAPRAGDQQWADALTTTALQSELFTSPVSAYDTDALSIIDPSIAARLQDAGRPAAFRVLVSTDPITSQKVAGGIHVGKTVYVNGTLLTDWVGLPDFNAHEPITIRQDILEILGDARTPDTAWRYRDITELPPARTEAEKGTRPGFETLRDAVLNYYSDRGLWFDSQAFTDDVQLMFDIEMGLGQ